MYTSSEDAIRAAAPAQALLLVAKADTDLSPPLARLRVYVATNDAPATLKITPLQKPNGSAAVDAIGLGSHGLGALVERAARTGPVIELWEGACFQLQAQDGSPGPVRLVRNPNPPWVACPERPV